MTDCLWTTLDCAYPTKVMRDVADPVRDRIPSWAANPTGHGGVRTWSE